MNIVFIGTQGGITKRQKRTANILLNHLSKDANLLFDNHVKSGDLIIAAPKTMKETAHSKIWTTIRYAKKLNKPLVLLHP